MPNALLVAENMFLANPAVPVSFSLEEAAKVIEKSLRKKNWRNFEKGEIRLALVPYYVFYYDAAFGEEGKPGRKTERGRLALNAETAELGKEIAEEIPEEESLAKEYPDDSYPFSAGKALISKKEAEKIALLKTASMVGTTRENIVLSGMQLVYYPTWNVFVTVAEENYELDISAVSGKIFGEERVPEREKGFVEITKETLNELKEPGAWLKYSKEVTGTVGKTIRKSGAGGSPKSSAGAAKESGFKPPSLFRDKMFWVSIVLLIILIIVVLYR